MGNALSVSARSERDETKTRTPTRTPNSPGRRVHQSSTQRATLSSVSSPDSNEDLHMACRKELKDSVVGFSFIVIFSPINSSGDQPVVSGGGSRSTRETTA